jgi:LmbE family N-acetylglucosaminyl deacetylase
MTHEQLARTRADEQREAAGVVGAKDVFILDHKDGALEVTQRLKRDIVRVIRQVQPDTVVAFDPSFLFSSELGVFNHTDHRAAGQATLDAVFPLARDHLTFPELLKDEQLEPHKVEHVLLSNFEHQEYYVDISDYFETKMQAITAHKSQFADPEMMREHLAKQAEALAVKTGSRYAEGFIRLDLAY